MSAADWYPDPTREGRLRYWDGSTWTAHVSEQGEVATDPIDGIAPAPPRADQAAGSGPPAATAAPAPAPAGGTATAVDAAPGDPAPGRSGMGGLSGMLAAGGPGGPTPLGRIGFLIAAVGFVIAAFSAGKVASEQGDGAEAFITFTLGNDVIAFGLIFAVVAVAAALAPWVWARVAGQTVGWLGAVLFALMVIGARAQDEFIEGVDVSLGTGGVLVAIAAILGFIGIGLAVYGTRVPVTAPDPANRANPREGKGIASLVTGIVGVVIPVAAPAAVSLGLLARDDDVASGGTVGYRGMAVAGIVLGIVSMVLWGIGLTIGMFVASP